MAKLDKDAYQGKREWAARKMADNAAAGSKNGLTEEQASALESLCEARHELHGNRKSAIMCGDNVQEIVQCNDELDAAGLPGIPGVPYGYHEDYLDIDNIDEMQELGIDFNGDDVPSSDDPNYENWLENTRSRISGELEELNTRIEHYLAEIDKKYGTSYNPSGATRL
jgi:hypothetical protein